MKRLCLRQRRIPAGRRSGIRVLDILDCHDQPATVTAPATGMSRKASLILARAEGCAKLGGARFCVNHRNLNNLAVF
jgi:hypothetical protein